MKNTKHLPKNKKESPLIHLWGVSIHLIDNNIKFKTLWREVKRNGTVELIIFKEAI